MLKVFISLFLLCFMFLPANEAKKKREKSFNQRQRRDMLLIMDSLVRKIKPDLVRASKKNQLKGRVAMVGFSLEEGLLTRGEVNYLLKKVENVSLHTPNFYFVRSVGGMNKLAAPKGVAKNINTDSVWDQRELAKKLLAEHFAEIRLVKKGRILRFKMKVYETKSGELIWSKVWFIPHRPKNFFIDFYTQSTFDSLYLVTMGTYVGFNAMNIFNFGANIGLFYSPFDKRYKNLSKHHFPGISVSLNLEASLLSSLVDNFDAMDILFFFRAGLYVGKIVNAEYTDYYTPGVIQTRPIFMFGLNFLFKQQGFIYCGADIGNLLNKEKKMPTIVSPVVGFGYRF